MLKRRHIKSKRFLKTASLFLLVFFINLFLFWQLISGVQALMLFVMFACALTVTLYLLVQLVNQQKMTNNARYFIRKNYQL